jgi:hypothetical protein
VDGHLNAVAMTGKMFIDRIVDDFPDEVVQPLFVCLSDVHAGAQTDCF